jgi:hypothetical protein
MDSIFEEDSLFGEIDGLAAGLAVSVCGENVSPVLM